MLKVDFHIHSNHSPDSLNAIEDILTIAQEKNIDRIVISDHNTISGALAAKEKDPERIIIGEEIMTDQGEVLGIFLENEVPWGLTLKETIELLKKQNAFIAVPHPFDTYRDGLGAKNLLHFIDEIDAIEVFNARCMQHRFNDQALAFAIENKLGQVVGSDAHTNLEIGSATLEVPFFKNADELRSVIREGKQNLEYSPRWTHFMSTYAKFSKKP